RAARVSGLSDGFEQTQHALGDQRGGVLVVLGKAAVDEEVSIAGIEEQLRLLDALVDLAGDVDVTHVVGVHRMHLQRDARRADAGLLASGPGRHEKGARQPRDPAYRPTKPCRTPRVGICPDATWHLRRAL